ncbi:MAG: thioredoxin [Bacillota bacterium]|nr:thioredoxin [Bacillota bacterium]NLJ03437.1 thioredoxin [Bacillota bacterium]
MSRFIDVTDEDFQAEVLEAEGPVLVEFWAVWCGPCRQMAPVVEDLAAEYADKIKFVKVNVDEVTESVGTYGIMSVPTIMLFKDGNPMETLVGVQPKPRLQEVLDNYL